MAEPIVPHTSTLVTDNVNQSFADMKSAAGDSGLVRYASSQLPTVPKSVMKKMAAGKANIFRQPASYYHPLYEALNLMLPTKTREINQFCRHFYKVEPIIGTSVDISSELPITGFTNVCDDPAIQKFFDTVAFDILDLPALLRGIALEYNKLGNCFTEDTLISTLLGFKYIKDIKSGDMVLTHTNTYKPVIQLMDRMINEDLYKIKIDKIYNSLRCTGEHPIMCLKENEEKWVWAKNIKVGDLVRIGKTNCSANGSIKRINIAEYLLNKYKNQDTIKISVNKSISYIKFNLFKGLNYEKTKKDKIKILNWLSSLETDFVDKTREDVSGLLGIDEDCLSNLLFELKRKIPEFLCKRTHNPQEMTRWHKINNLEFNENVFSKISKRTFNSNIKEIDITPELMYVIGYWYGDGWLNKNTRNEENYGLKYSRWDICFGRKSTEHMNRIRKILKRIGIKHGISEGLKSSPLSSTLNVFIKDSLFCDWWYDNFGASCKDKKIPSWVLSLQEEEKKMFIAGIIDSDGSVSKNMFEISGVNEEFMNQIFDMLVSLGYYPNIIKEEKKSYKLPNGTIGECTVVRVTCFNCHDLIEKAIKGKFYDLDKETDFSQNKKFTVRNGNVFYRVNNIRKEVKNTKVYNFAVEEDNSYVANHIVVHNCFPFGEWNEGAGVWLNFTLLNPDFVEVEKSILVEDPIMKLDPDDNIKRIIMSRQPKKLYEKLEKIDDGKLVALIRRGEKVPLDPDHVSHIAHKLSPYETVGTPMMFRAFKALIYKDYLRRAQMAIAERHITPLKLVKVGSDTIPAQPEAITNVRESLEDLSQDLSAWFVYHHAISVEYVASSGHVLPLNTEYDWIDKEIMIAMGMSKAVLMGEGPSFATASVGYQVLISRYLKFQAMLSTWVEKFVYKRIAKAQNFYRIDPISGQKELVYPKIEFELMRLREDAQLRTLYQGLVKAGLVSKRTFYATLGLNYEQEKRYIAKEAIETQHNLDATKGKKQEEKKMDMLEGGGPAGPGMLPPMGGEEGPLGGGGEEAPKGLGPGAGGEGILPPRGDLTPEV